MTDLELQELMKTDREGFFSKVRSDEGAAYFKSAPGNWVLGRKPYLNEYQLVDGSKITFKYVNTLKWLLDAKMRRIHGRDSFLSYVEITAHPVGQKPYSRIFDVKQVCIGVPREVSEAKHIANVAKLMERAADYGINLTDRDSDAWQKVYDESYKERTRAA